MSESNTAQEWESREVSSSGEQQKSQKRKKKGMTFTLRVTLTFVIVSLMTIFSAVAMLSFVWEQHFQSYTRENMERLANSTADSIAVAYERYHGDWYGGTLAAASSAGSLYDTVSIQVTNELGSVVYDNTNDQGKPAFTNFNEVEKNTAIAPIIVQGKQVGTVYVRVFGSDTLLTQPDQDFRTKSYQAMIFASVFAIVIALLAGIAFARALVRPINRITHAAQELKEGNYSARTNLSGNDEISRLGNTFDRMADAIESNRKLERRLVTDVAHELRTPLMAIQSTVEAMIDGVFKPDAERLETLNSEVRRLSRLVDALLKLSRLENRSNPVEFSKVDLTELIETIVTNHQAYVSDAGLTLEYHHDSHVFVYGNADMLRQATANLISNAVRYTPEGGTITVMVRKGDIMGQIMVKDTGIGLTPEEAKMVFSRFWRADPGRARATGGLGIGLSVVKEIVDRHRGWVRVEGRPNEGACFTIYVPLYNENEGDGHKRKKNQLGQG